MPWALRPFTASSVWYSVRQLMSTVAFTRSSSAASHCAIVLPIDMPSVPTRAGSTSARALSQSSARIES